MSYRSWNQKERANDKWASQLQKPYLRWKNWGQRVCVPLCISVHSTPGCEQGIEQLCLCGSCSGKCLVSSARHSSIHCVQAHMDKHWKENIFLSYGIEHASPTAFGNALEIYFEKYFLFCSRPVATQTVPNALATHCYKRSLWYSLFAFNEDRLDFKFHLSLLFRAVWMSWCTAPLFEESLFSPCIPLLHVRSSTANDLTCLYHVTHIPRYCIISHWHSVLYQLWI